MEFIKYSRYTVKLKTNGTIILCLLIYRDLKYSLYKNIFPTLKINVLTELILNNRFINFFKENNQACKLFYCNNYVTF